MKKKIKIFICFFIANYFLYSNIFSGALASQYNTLNDAYVSFGASTFSDEEKQSKNPFEIYSPLDSLGRCGVAYANICKEIMPTKKRDSIGMIKPTGWQTPQSKYDFVDGKYLYNRCHLIAFELAGENANEQNLVTGTHFMNINGMLPFENKVANHVKSTNHHVLYRSTPVFEGNNLLCEGVQIEAYCVEEQGGSIDFNVFCYNVQPGVDIDYATGKNWLSNSNTVLYNNKNSVPNDARYIIQNSPYTKEQESVVEQSNTFSSTNAQTYVLNMNSKKIHYPSCSSVTQMKESNKKVVNDTVDNLKSRAYKPCGRCNPK